MERYKVKRMLFQYRNLVKECHHLKEDTVELRSQMDGIKAQRLTGMPKGSQRSEVVEINLDKLAELERRWDQKFTEMTDTLVMIDDAIGSLEDSRHRIILRLRYLNGFEWERIAYSLGYSWRNTHRLHNEALDEIGKVFDKM